MQKIMRYTLLTGLLFAASAGAHQIQAGQMLPQVAVSDKGEIVLNNADVTYQSWSSSGLPGKVHVVQHFAARTAAKEKNQALVDAIKAAHFNAAKYQTTSIINADDAVIGTGMFVTSSAEKGKKENAHSQVVLDAKGAVKKAWGLREKDSAIILLDKTGKVQFVKEGQLTAAEVQEVIERIKQLSQ